MRVSFLSLGSSLKDEGRLCLPVLMAVTIAGSAVEPVMAELFLLSTGLNTDLLTKTIFKGLPLFFPMGGWLGPWMSTFPQFFFLGFTWVT